MINTSARIPEQLLDAVDKLAEQEKRNTSSMIRILLEEALENREKKQPRRKQ